MPSGWGGKYSSDLFFIVDIPETASVNVAGVAAPTLARKVITSPSVYPVPGSVISTPVIALLIPPTLVMVNIKPSPVPPVRELSGVSYGRVKLFQFVPPSEIKTLVTSSLYRSIGWKG